MRDVVCIDETGTFTPEMITALKPFRHKVEQILCDVIRGDRRNLFTTETLAEFQK